MPIIAAGWLVGKRSHGAQESCCTGLRENLSIDIIPVIDLKGGCVVRGIAGQREKYLPVVSQICPSPNPIAVAQAFRNVFDLRRLYLADLDAIAGLPPSADTYRALHQEGFSLLVDAGVSSTEDVRRLLDFGVETVVVGLETLRRPRSLEAILQEHPSSKILFSLDLINGEPMGDRAAWGWQTPEEILDHVLSAGANRILLLDLARVGVSEGTGTEGLAQRALSHHAKKEVIVGGGVRGIDDLRQLVALGVDGVLIASALHDGRLTPADIAAVTTLQPGAS